MAMPANQRLPCLHKLYVFTTFCVPRNEPPAHKNVGYVTEVNFIVFKVF